MTSRGDPIISSGGALSLSLLCCNQHSLLLLIPRSNLVCTYTPSPGYAVTITLFSLCARCREPHFQQPVHFADLPCQSKYSDDMRNLRILISDFFFTFFSFLLLLHFTLLTEQCFSSFFFFCIFWLSALNLVCWICTMRFVIFFFLLFGIPICWVMPLTVPPSAAIMSARHEYCAQVTLNRSEISTMGLYRKKKDLKKKHVNLFPPILCGMWNFSQTRLFS